MKLLTMTLCSLLTWLNDVVTEYTDILFSYSEPVFSSIGLVSDLFQAINS